MIHKKTKNQARKLAALRRDLEQLAQEDGQQRGIFFDTSGNLRSEDVSATSLHTWLFKTRAGKPFHWNQPDTSGSRKWDRGTRNPTH